MNRAFGRPSCVRALDSEELLPFRKWGPAVGMSLGLAAIIGGLSLAIGIISYRMLGGLPWVDSILEACMIMGGENGAPMNNDAVKLFFPAYTLFSGLIFAHDNGHSRGAMAGLGFCHHLNQRYEREEVSLLLIAAGRRLDDGAEAAVTSISMRIGSVAAGMCRQPSPLCNSPDKQSAQCSRATADKYRSS